MLLLLADCIALQSIMYPTFQYRVLFDGSDAIGCSVRVPKHTSASCSLVLILPGFRAWSGWGFFPDIAQRCTTLQNESSSYISLVVDFPSNGYSLYSDSYNESQPLQWQFSKELFEKGTVSQDCKNLHYLLSMLEQNPDQVLGEAHTLWNREVVWIGHSRGATLAAIVFSEYYQKQLCSLTSQQSTTHLSIKKLLLLAPVPTFSRFTQRQKHLWEKSSVMHFGCGTQGEVYSLNVTYLHDIEQNGERFGLSASLSKITSNVHVISAEQDMITPMRHIHAMISHARLLAEPRLLHLSHYCVESTGHTFGIVHPMELVHPLPYKKILTYLQQELLSSMSV